MKKPLLITGIVFFAAIAGAQTTFEKAFTTPDNFEGAYYAEQTSDGGYIMCGAEVIKTNSTGDTTWTYPLLFSRTIKQTSDGGYITGSGNLTKLTSAGELDWEVAVPSRGISIASDGGYITCPESNLLLKKTSSTGSVQWTSSNFGVPGISQDGWSAIEVPSGGFVLSGTRTDDQGFDTQITVVKVDASGGTVWGKYFGNTSYTDQGYEVINTSDGGFIVVGTTGSYGTAGSFNLYLIKLNSAGTSEWTKAFGGTGEDGGYGISQTTDGGYIVVGASESYATHGGIDVYLLKINATGTEEWHKSFGGSGDDYGYSVKQTADGGYVIAGVKDDGTATPKMYLIKTNSSGNVVGVNGHDELAAGISIYPNPASNFITVNVKQYTNGSQVSALLYDVTGKLLQTRTVNQSRFNMDISTLSKGIYVLSVFDGESTVNRKIIKE